MQGIHSKRSLRDGCRHLSLRPLGAHLFCVYLHFSKHRAHLFAKLAAPDVFFWIYLQRPVFANVGCCHCLVVEADRQVLGDFCVWWRQLPHDFLGAWLGQKDGIAYETLLLIIGVLAVSQDYQSTDHDGKSEKSLHGNAEIVKKWMYSAAPVPIG